jgi:ketosteroid isomerase-like protein
MCRFRQNLDRYLCTRARLAPTVRIAAAAQGGEVSQHPNFTAIQSSWDALAAGDLVGALDLLADDVVVDNGPGAGPWRHLEGKEAFFTMAMQFVPWFQGTWAQEGRCVYADDDMSIAVVGERGRAPSGDVFDNVAVYVYRFNENGKVNRLWTTDLAHEVLEDFWRRNPIEATD